MRPISLDLCEIVQPFIDMNFYYQIAIKEYTQFEVIRYIFSEKA